MNQEQYRRQPTPKEVLHAIDLFVAYLDKCGYEQAIVENSGGVVFRLDDIYDTRKHIIAEAVAAEREACAAMCDEQAKAHNAHKSPNVRRIAFVYTEIAAAIRARAQA